jgi:drug/metabolite transporter (DMT)-like permease
MVSREEPVRDLVSDASDSTRTRSAGPAIGAAEKRKASRASALDPYQTTSARSGSANALLDAVPWLALHLATVLWGTQHAVIKQLVDSGFDASVLNMERFGIAASVSVAAAAGLHILDSWNTSRRPGRRKAQQFPQNWRFWRRILETWSGALELGLWMFLGYACQSIGLTDTSASRSSFLLYLNVKIVPFLAAVLLRRRIPRVTWLAATIALFGTLMLSFDGAPPNAGDAWSVAAAVASAMFILRLERVASQMPPATMNALSLTTVTILATLWSAFRFDDSGRPVFDWAMLGSAAQHITDPAILYLGLAATALSGLLQAFGQEHISAERAAIIYALDPVYAAAFAYLLLGETLGPRGILGAAIVFIAALLSQGAIRSWLSDRLETRAENGKPNDS